MLKRTRPAMNFLVLSLHLRHAFSEQSRQDDLECSRNLPDEHATEGSLSGVIGREVAASSSRRRQRQWLARSKAGKPACDLAMAMCDAAFG
mmetsp:Transcript_15446/g.24699  ORF Transcript_15446/g.24699 Transcript_15446/m.24699 type:complete len:91 (+) Transcript_15446:212-484(+)